MIYADIANFKSFNDRYGFERGDEVIKHTASVLLEAVRERGAKGDFVGHIGGDDFIILTTPENGVPVCEQTIALFDAGTPSFYDPADRAQGYIVSTDRNNAVQRFPLMTIALAVIATDNRRVVHYAQLSEIAAELKKEAKKKNRSAFVVDRRNN
jgi:diguanylate cyclase (GGDEF)-like protein